MVDLSSRAIIIHYEYVATEFTHKGQRAHIIWFYIFSSYFISSQNKCGNAANNERSPGTEMSKTTRAHTLIGANTLTLNFWYKGTELDDIHLYNRRLAKHIVVLCTLTLLPSQKIYTHIFFAETTIDARINVYLIKSSLELLWLYEISVCAVKHL